jgi:hypothetical protein
MDSENNQGLKFDFATVFCNTKMFIDSYNARQTQLTKKLNANHRATAELIVRLYLKQLNQAGNLRQIEQNNLPGFNTYNGSLAKCKGCTNRTIMNHKRRLKQSGFITTEKSRGKGGLEIQICPTVLGIGKLSTNLGDNVVKIEDIASVFFDKVKNFHPLVHEPQEQLNNNSNVDNIGVPDGHGYGLSLPSAHTNPRDKATRTGHEQNKNTEKNANPVYKRQESVSKRLEAEKQEQQAGAGRIFLLSLIRQFYHYAIKVLYPQLILSEPEEREILNLIWKSVYGELRWQASERDWLKFQDICYNRVNMVARWLARSSDRWLPKPHIYFHPNNERNSFKATMGWHMKQETLKVEIRNQLLLQQINAEWQQHGQCKGRFKEKTRLQLFRIQQKRLAHYRDESLQSAFQECLQQNLHLSQIKNHALRKNAV